MAEGVAWPAVAEIVGCRAPCVWADEPAWAPDGQSIVFQRTDLVGGRRASTIERYYLKQGQVGHACEYETSMMLRIAPHLVVGDLAKIPEVPFGNAFAPASRAWITKDRTEPGHIGHPAIATAEKGETIFRVFTADVVKFLERVLAWDGKSWEG